MKNKSVRLNSFFHYEIVADGEYLVLREYGEECCSMYEYVKDSKDGKEVARWPKGSKRKFTYVKNSRLYPADRGGMHIATTSASPTEGLMCGDDIRYHLREGHNNPGR